MNSTEVHPCSIGPCIDMFLVTPAVVSAVRCVAEMLMVTETSFSLLFHGCWLCSSMLWRALGLSWLHSLLLGIKMTTKACKWLSRIQQLADAGHLGSAVTDVRALSIRRSFLRAFSTWFGLCFHLESSCERMLSACLEQLIPWRVRGFNEFFSEVWNY